MKKIFLLLVIFSLSINSVFAAKIPDDIKALLQKNFPSVDIRFDGVVILPDNTIYLPLYPAKIKNPEKIEVFSTFPEKVTLNKKPDVVIFNNDFVLLKVLTNKDGSRTVMKFEKPPLVVKTGLLPQDMLVPKNLIIPENLKGILGALNVRIEKNQEIKKPATKIEYEKDITVKKIKTLNSKSAIPQLKDKVLYVLTTYSKEIQVVKGEKSSADYAFDLKMIPRHIDITPDTKFLLLTTYNSPLVEIISVADDKVIKQVEISKDADEIVIDRKNNLAYISCPSDSTIYQMTLEDMTLKKKIKINGYCEKLTLCDNYLIYVDKMSNKIWSIEFDNEYTLKDLGSYPNISKLAYSNGYLFLTSRTKNRVAVLDYKNETLFTEFKTVQKPVDMLIYGHSVFVLGAGDNKIQVIDRESCEPVSEISIGTNGFPTQMKIIPNSTYLMISDTKSGKYHIVDMVSKNVVKTNLLDIPVKQFVIGKNIRKL